ncbi:MAG: hypothetical protein WCB80_32275 [Mycobacterium sp.]
MFESGDDCIEYGPVVWGDVGVGRIAHGLADFVVELLQPAFQRCDLPSGGVLRPGQGGGDVFEVHTEFGQLQRLRPQQLNDPWHLVGIVDRMVAVLVIPRRLKPLPRLLKGLVGLGSTSTRSVKRLRQVCNLSRAPRLQSLVDRPRIPAGLGNQMWNAYVSEPHRTDRIVAAFRASISLNLVVARCALLPTAPSTS